MNSFQGLVTEFECFYETPEEFFRQKDQHKRFEELGNNKNTALANLSESDILKKFHSFFEQIKEDLKNKLNQLIEKKKKSTSDCEKAQKLLDNLKEKSETRQLKQQKLSAANTAYSTILARVFIDVKTHLINSRNFLANKKLYISISYGTFLEKK